MDVPPRPRDPADQVDRLHSVMTPRSGVPPNYWSRRRAIALLILGGALTELLAVDIAPAANADVVTSRTGPSLFD